MKLTPEKKALIEYGKAFFLMRSATQSMFWREESHSEIRREFIQDAWNKRAVCRAWAVPLIRRDCYNCAYNNIKPIPVVCDSCINEGFAVNWEPRKEGV